MNNRNTRSLSVARFVPAASAGILLAAGALVMAIAILSGGPDEVHAGVDNDGDGFIADVDCDDFNNTVYPGAPEVPDGIDNDCDGLIDDEGTSTPIAPTPIPPTPIPPTPATPTSAPVGDVAEPSDANGTPLESAGGSGRNTGLLAGIAVAVAGGIAALGVAAWYARRRATS